MGLGHAVCITGFFFFFSRAHAENVHVTKGVLVSLTDLLGQRIALPALLRFFPFSIFLFLFLSLDLQLWLSSARDCRVKKTPAVKDRTDLC